MGIINGVGADKQSDMTKAVEHQKETISGYLIEDEIDDYDVIIDNGSGYPNKCGGFIDLCDAIRSGKYDVVVVSELSRFTRNTTLYVDFLGLLQKNNAVLKLVDAEFGKNKFMDIIKVN